MRPYFAHLLAAVIVVAAACGGTAPPPQTAVPSPAGSGSASAAPSSPTAPLRSETSPAGAPSGAAPAPSEGSATAASVPIVPSKMIADIKAIGIDLANPPDLAKLDLAKKRKLMPFFVKALGMTNCEGCHVAGDFKAPTHNKHMASAMWTHFVRELRAKDGGALFCDSCHQGKQKLLVRTDKKLLSTFMRDNYEDKLARANKKDHSCETCHGDPFEGKVFAKLWKVGPQ